MRRLLAAAAAVLLCLVHIEIAFAQGGNASVGGFVQDPTQAFIPGVTVTATNTGTNITTSAITNESGAYTIVGLLPGTYKLTAELPGFKTQVINDVQLGQSAAARYNFTLQVGAANQTIEVTAESTAVISETSSTIGNVLAQKTVTELPLVSNNVLDLVTSTMAGVRGTDLTENTTFAGVSASMVNTVRDGLSVQNGRYANGIGSVTYMNTEMVGEFRVILTPVDAEYGRGNGQVQVMTRSGTNQFHGSGVWTVRNSKLDANTWTNNKAVVNGKWTPTAPPWLNRNELTGSVGGPIVKNKTFFFALVDKQIENERQVSRAITLTDCAQRGIFRYWSGYTPGNITTQTVLGGASPTIASVDSFGNPLFGGPSGPPAGVATPALQYRSVFGPLVSNPTKPDCSDAVVSGSPWDANRSKMDPSGTSQKFLAVMPHANTFDGGDGLNTAVTQWTWRGHSLGDYPLASGNTFDANRLQFNGKVDHNFNAKHKVAVNYTNERINSDYYNSGVGGLWPGYYPQQMQLRPQVFTVNFTSTLTSNIVNEARYGYRKSYQYIYGPWEVPDPEQRKVPLSFQLQGGKNAAGQTFPIAYAPSGVGLMSVNNYTCLTLCAIQNNNTPLTSYADSVSWNKGKHAFKGGVEVLLTHTTGVSTADNTMPQGVGGNSTLNPVVAFANTTNFNGLTPTTQTTAQQLLAFMAGSVATATQRFYMKSPTELDKWTNYLDQQRRVIEPHENEMSVFFKDNWKLRPSFTLNAGVRWQYYGVPYEGKGLTIRPQGGQDGLALFGVSGRSFSNWMNPNAGVNTSLLTQLEFVGPKTSKPGDTIFPDDYNNFGPAVGFAWDLPWFGKGKTNVRGGYQISYTGGGHAGNLSNYIFTTPGFLTNVSTPGPVDGSYFDVAALQKQIPLTPATLPMQAIPLAKLSQGAAAFDPNFYTPYIQNFTLSITREITRKLSLDVRYVGTKGTGLYGWFDLNTPDVFYNNPLFNALKVTRAGGDDPLFDQLFLGLNIAPGINGCNPANPGAACGAVDGITQRGSQAMRLSTTFRDALANGDFVTLANSLNYFNGVGTGASGTVPVTVTGERGTVMKRANLGFNVPGGTTIPGGPVVPAGLFPANWISANPQFGTGSGIGAGANYWSNNGTSKYHSLQLQGTMRATHGITFQATYIFSKSMQSPLTSFAAGNGLTTAQTYTNPVERNKDWQLSPGNAKHDFKGYGTFELPFGPGKLLFRGSHGVLARVIEGWQASSVVNLSAGAPANISASYVNPTVIGNSPTGLYGNSVPDIVGNFPRDGSVNWVSVSNPNDHNFGSYFGSFTRTKDPQCAAVASNLQSFCTLQAVADSNGKIVLQNPQPGTRGSLGLASLTLPGNWSFDAALSKSVRIAEGKSLLIRMDSTNVLNHPTPSSPVLNINGATPFGSIQDKGNQRRFFKGSVRLTF
jgi:hypothetical protein